MEGDEGQEEERERFRRSLFVARRSCVARHLPPHLVRVCSAYDNHVALVDWPLVSSVGGGGIIVLGAVGGLEQRGGRVDSSQ